MVTRQIVGGLIAAVFACAFSGPVYGEVLEKTGTFAGLTVAYRIVVPEGYDPARTYPAILAFTGGPQTMQGVVRMLDADWRKEAERRGYIVVSPAAPNGSLFFESGDRIFPAFLEAILSQYRIKDRKFYIAGLSNGGLSAFHIAALHPQYFWTVTGYPGLLDGPDASRASALKSMCLFMHVGDRDAGWLSAMQQQASDLKRKGFNIQFTVEKNQGHILRADEINLSPRLYDEIESCRR